MQPSQSSAGKHSGSRRRRISAAKPGTSGVNAKRQADVTAGLRSGTRGLSIISDKPDDDSDETSSSEEGFVIGGVGGSETSSDSPSQSQSQSQSQYSDSRRGGGNSNSSSNGLSAIGGITDRGLNMELLTGQPNFPSPVLQPRGVGGAARTTGGAAGAGAADAKKVSKAVKNSPGKPPAKERKPKPKALYLYIQMEFCEGMTLREVIDKVMVGHVKARGGGVGVGKGRA